ncbi:unnamed protein product [Calicophoron daubneyi]
MTIPWAMTFSIALVSHLPGTAERPRLIRRTCFRYLLGSLVLTLTRINVVAKKRFPSFESMIAAGIFTKEEISMIEATPQQHGQPFLPIVWATSLVTMAEKEGLITNHHAAVLIIQEFNNFRQALLNLFLMDYVCVPLVYTQVVTLSVYSYFAASLIGRQYIIDRPQNDENQKSYYKKDLYFPFFTFIQFVIYVGWLKVAETLVNPMGEDDEDIDINEVIDFNWKAGWCIVDGMKPAPPALVRDAHWDRSAFELPHTMASKRFSLQTHRGSVFESNMKSSPECMGSTSSIANTGQSQESLRYRTGRGQSPVKVPDSLSDIEVSSQSDLGLSVPMCAPRRFSPSPTLPVRGMGTVETIHEESDEELERERSECNDASPPKPIVRVVVKKKNSSQSVHSDISDMSTSE